MLRHESVACMVEASRGDRRTGMHADYERISICNEIIGTLYPRKGVCSSLEV